MKVLTYESLWLARAAPNGLGGEETASQRRFLFVCYPSICAIPANQCTFSRQA